VRTPTGGRHTQQPKLPGAQGQPPHRLMTPHNPLSGGAQHLDQTRMGLEPTHPLRAPQHSGHAHAPQISSMHDLVVCCVHDSSTPGATFVVPPALPPAAPGPTPTTSLFFRCHFSPSSSQPCIDAGNGVTPNSTMLQHDYTDTVTTHAKLHNTTTQTPATTAHMHGMAWHRVTL
jgi:hypothetical protein